MRVVSTAPAGLHAELGEFCRDVLSMRGRADLLVDVQDSSVEADVECPTRSEGLIFVHHTIRGRDLACGVAQQRVVHSQRLGKRFVGLGCIDADREVRDVELSNRVATLTE